MKSLSRVRLIVTPWTAAYQAPPSMGFSRQEDWSGVPLPSPNPCQILSFIIPGGSDGKDSAFSVGDAGSIPWLGRSPGEGNCYLLQYSGLENPIDRVVWRFTTRGVAKSQTRLSDFHFIIPSGANYLK